MERSESWLKLKPKKIVWIGLLPEESLLWMLDCVLLHIKNAPIVQTVLANRLNLFRDVSWRWFYVGMWSNLYVLWKETIFGYENYL